MAITFHPNIRNLYMGRGIAAGFANPFSITVYAGTQPTAAHITSNWTLYNEASSNYLVHYTGASWSQPSNGILLQLGLPTAATPFRTGVATWAILWSSAVSLAAVQGATLPNAAFIVVPCSDSTGSGVVRFTSTSLTAGVSVAIQDGSMGAYIV